MFKKKIKHTLKKIYIYLILNGSLEEPAFMFWLSWNRNLAGELFIWFLFSQLLNRDDKAAM